MVDLETIRKQAMALPEVVEKPHFGRPAFRVRDTLFLSTHLQEEPPSVIAHVSPERAAASVAAAPDLCEEVRRTHGGRQIFVGLRIHLDPARAGDVGLLLSESIRGAWRHRAPKRLVAQHTAT